MKNITDTHPRYNSPLIAWSNPSNVVFFGKNEKFDFYFSDGNVIIKNYNYIYMAGYGSHQQFENFKEAVIVAIHKNLIDKIKADEMFLRSEWEKYEKYPT